MLLKKKKIHIPWYMNNNSKQSDLAGLLWSLDSGCWILIFLESFLHFGIAFLSAQALRIVIQPALRGAAGCHRICSTICLHMHFLEDCSVEKRPWNMDTRHRTGTRSFLWITAGCGWAKCQELSGTDSHQYGPGGFRGTAGGEQRVGRSPGAVC